MPAIATTQCAFRLEHCGLTLIEEPDPVEELKLERLFQEPKRRLVERLIAEAERSEMHWNHRLGVKLTKGLEGLLRIHVDVTFRRRLIGPDRQESNFNVRPRSNFLKAFEVSGVAAVEDRSSGVFDKKASKSAVAIVQDACAPMPRGCQGDFERAVLEALPVAQFVNPVESQIMYQIANVLWDRDRLIAGYRAQRAAIKMIEVSMGDEYEIDGRKVAELNPGILHAFDDLEPFCPIGIDKHAVLGSLNEKRRMPNPSDANLAVWEFGENWFDSAAVTSGKE